MYSVLNNIDRLWTDYGQGQNQCGLIMMCFCLSLFLFMVMNFIYTIMYELCSGYEIDKLDYIFHILIMDIMAIIDDYGMGSSYVSAYLFEWLWILLKVLCMSYVLVMKMIQLDYVLHGNYGQLWSNYGHYRPLWMIMKCFSKKHIIDT